MKSFNTEYLLMVAKHQANQPVSQSRVGATYSLKML